jgi:dTMP kinase
MSALPASPGCYVVLDGPDGCGKSSQARALCEWLRQLGHEVLPVREPGSTPVGEALRRLLLSPQTGELALISEALLFSAARAELVGKVIAPALAAGQIVVAERCFVSTLVYQGLAPALPRGHGPGMEWLLDLARRVHGPCLPAAIFLLDVPASVAASRRAARTVDRIEGRDLAFHERVRQGYLAVARAEVRAQVVDAAWPFPVVQANLRAAMQRLLAGTHPACP